MRGFYENITIRKLASVSPQSVTVNSDGSWSIEQDDVTVKGSFHHKLMYDRNPENMGQYGQRLVAVARLPLSTEVSQGDQIVISNKHESVNGVYEISAIMFTSTHQRCEVRRISTP